MLLRRKLGGRSFASVAAPFPGPAIGLPARASQCLQMGDELVGLVILDCCRGRFSQAPGSMTAGYSPPRDDKPVGKSLGRGPVLRRRAPPVLRQCPRTGRSGPKPGVAAHGLERVYGAQNEVRGHALTLTKSPTQWDAMSCSDLINIKGEVETKVSPRLKRCCP